MKCNFLSESLEIFVSGGSVTNGYILLCRLVQGLKQALMDSSGMELDYPSFTFSIYFNCLVQFLLVILVLIWFEIRLVVGIVFHCASTTSINCVHLPNDHVSDI